MSSLFSVTAFDSQRTLHLAHGLVDRVFANCSGDQGQPQVESYQRLKKWYLIPPCLTLGIISNVSMVK